MPDIKLHKRSTGTIKTLNRDVKALRRNVREGRDIKEAAGVTSDPDAAPSPEAAPANLIEHTAGRNAEKAGQTGMKVLNYSARQPFTVKDKMQRAAHSNVRAKEAMRDVGRTIKTGVKDIKTTAQGAKAAKDTVKTAQSGIKVVESAARTAKTAQQAAQAAATTVQATAKTAAQNAKIAAQTAQEAARIAAHTVRAAYHAAVATVQAVIHGTSALISLIAAGGWIAVVVIVVVAVVAALAMSAIGIFMANEDSVEGGKTLSTVQSELSLEFHDRLEEQKTALEGYDQIEVRPAPAITAWGDILAVFAVRAQQQEISPAQMTDDAMSLLRSTMWDIISFSMSEEQVTSVEQGADGREVTVTTSYGIINVAYKSIDEMAAAYGFSAEEQEMLAEVMGLYEENGGMIIGGGQLINPCPGGNFNGNDYPAYAGSSEYHAGRDIAAPMGTPIYAAAGGTVIHINDQSPNYGNHIMIAHGDEVYTLYAHCETLLVTSGQTVAQGQLIATVGSTGNSTGPHCHFEVRAGGSQYRVNNADPLLYLTN